MATRSIQITQALVTSQEPQESPLTEACPSGLRSPAALRGPGARLLRFRGFPGRSALAGAAAGRRHPRALQGPLGLAGQPPER